MIEKADPMVTQNKKKKRMKRMVEFYDLVFDECTKNSGASLIDDMFERFTNKTD